MFMQQFVQMRGKTPILLFAVSFFLLAYKGNQQETPSASKVDIIQYVNPFIGTGGHGHTYPGATMPFGMMQLSPDTRLIGWDGCSGYHYSDDTIFGFSHTHLSGTGVSDYGDILLMPINHGEQLSDDSLTYADFKSPFNHVKEKANPGFYEVYLDRPEANVKLTTTPRCGYHKYQFDDPLSPAVILDLEHRDEVLSCHYEIISDRRIEGHRHSNAWAQDQRLFFVLEFSEPFLLYKNYKCEENKWTSKGAFLFPANTKEIEIKIAISAVDIEGARKNFNSELGSVGFEKTLENNQNEWRKELRKIEVESKDDEVLSVFYSALYHTMLAPNIYNDVDGRYRGMDLEIHQGREHDHYTVFSLWDTYRATHPLHTIIDQKRTSDFVKTMLDKYQQGGIIPIWDLSANYTGCMIGYHGVSVIADAYVKGIRDYDTDLAYEAIKHSAMQDHLGLQYYKKHGFISMQQEAESVSKTLEYAYDDWCIAQVAKDLGKGEDYDHFTNRSLYYRNLFDPETKFFRPKRNNFWLDPFDPFEVNSNYTEANAWHYGFTAAHDMDGFINLHGGDQALESHLDELFTTTSETTGRDQVDITGLIGQYAHGNEPSHHIAYLYNYIGKPWKTQKQVRDILNSQYQNAPDGISGNEDCGQMSAWYVLSAMGLYSVLPGSDYYVIGSPLLDKAKINLENGQSFTITSENNSATNVYIQKLLLNDKEYNNSFIKHEDIMKGGNLHFVMGPRANQKWGAQKENRPASRIDDSKFVQAPFISKGNLSFSDSTEIEVSSIQKEAVIYYGKNNGLFREYASGEKIIITEKSKLCVYSEIGKFKSPTVCTEFSKRDADVSIVLQSSYADMYNGGSKDALVDGLFGGVDFRTGAWQGFEGKDVEVIVDLGRVRKLNKIGARFLQDENSWIFFPSQVNFSISTDGKSYADLESIFPKAKPSDKGAFTEEMERNLSQAEEARYIKFKAKSLIMCPPWHKGAAYNGKAWVFIDEVFFEED